MKKPDPGICPLSQELQGVPELIRSPDFETRKRAVGDLSRIALRLIKSDEGSEKLACLLELDTDMITGRLKAEVERMDSFLEAANAGTWEWVVPSGLEIFDERCAAIAGYSTKDLEKLGDDAWDKITHPDDLEVSKAKIQACIDGESDYYVCELRTRHKNGNWVWLEDKGKVVERDENGNAVRIIGISTDITDRKEMQEKQAWLSSHDLLTGLHNRNHMEEKLTELKCDRRQVPVSFINVDVDDMKYVNDNFGHPSGDQVLRDVGAMLSQSSRAEDCAARAGGDEFLIILPKTDKEQASAMVDRIRNSLARYNLAHPDSTISLSIGASTSENTTTWDNALKEADESMYIEKNAKKTKVPGGIVAEIDQ